jgi:hypothetical protein
MPYSNDHLAALALSGGLPAPLHTQALARTWRVIALFALSFALVR